MNTTVDTSARALIFISRLRELSRGELAMLKRNAGENIKSSRDAIVVFYQISRGLAMSPWEEDTYFLVATLYALYPDSDAECGGFGVTLREIRKKTSASLDMRVKRLLECEPVTEENNELGFKLRQMVNLAKAKIVKINWPLLIEDLSSWGSDKCWVQRKWAKQYYAEPETNEALKTQQVEG